MKPEIDAFCNSSIAYFETPKQWFHNTFSDRFATCNPFHENKKHILFITRSFKITSTAVTFKCPTSSQGQ